MTENRISPEIKYKLIADQVIAALKGDRKPVPGIRFPEQNQLVIQTALKFPMIIFENAEIDSLFLSQIEMPEECNIVMEQCQLGFVKIHKSKFRDINFKSCILRDLDIDDDNSTDKISIEESRIIDGIVIRNKNNIAGLDICKNSQIGGIEISNSSTGNITINDFSSAGTLLIGEQSKIGNITIAENCVTGDFSCESSTLESISIQNNTKSGILKIKNNSVVGEIKFNNAVIGDIFIMNSFSSAIEFQHCENLPKLSITGSRTGPLYISDTDITSVYINRFSNKIMLSKWSVASMRIVYSEIPSLRTTGLASGEVFISDTKIDHLDLSATNISASCSLTLARCAVYAVQFEYANVLGPLFLRKLDALTEILPFNEQTDSIPSVYNTRIYENEDIKLKIKQLLDEWRFDHEHHKEHIRGIFPKPTFRLVHSSLGKAELSECNFGGFTFQYYNSKLLDCFITGTELPNAKDVLVHNGKEQLTNPSWQWHRQRMFFFNQIKRAYENIGDSVAAGQQHALAMNEQKHVLENTESKTPGEQRKLRFDKFTFTLNSISNHHGENWWRALWLTVVCGSMIFVFYLSHLWLRQSLYFGKTENYANSLWNNARHISEWFLLTHRFDFITNDVGGWGKFWDFFGRIVIGFGIYQFIAAFRRHGKKAI